jgi:hypothetical protein
MAVQQLSNLSNKPFIIGEPGIAKSCTFAREAQRSGDLEQFTLVAYNPSTGYWVPLTNVAATNGTQHPAGIVLKTVTEAALQADNVENIPVLIGNAIVDADQLVYENSVTLGDIIRVPTNNAKTVERELNELGIFCGDTIDTTELAGVNL